ncbi:MAG: TRAP transporter large permease [Phycisphaerae bacterium]|nr:TRAP transporter large permease [Phycisphaerae bacterium]
MLTVALCFLALIVLILLGFPIFVAICLVGGAATVASGDSLMLVVTNVFGGIDSFSLMAIPLFILAGFVMTECNITERLVDLSDAMVGRFRGSLGHVNILSSMFFASIQGSGVATTAAIGPIMIPAMIKQGYGKDYAVAVTASAAVIGPIIPPSIAMIMFSYYTGLSVAKLFLGGLIPGILVGLGLMAVNAVYCRIRGYDPTPRPHGLKSMLRAFVRSLGGLMIPVIIVAGIAGGKFTPTESGAAAVIYGLAYGLISRRFKLRRLPAVLIGAANTTAIVMIVLAVSKVFSNVLVRAKFQSLVVEQITGGIGNAYIATLAIMAVLIFLGSFLDPTVLITMFATTVAAVGASLGFDPVHYAVLMAITMLLGALTPPVGSMLFVSCSIAGLPIERSVRVLLPFFAVLIIVAVLVLFVPQLVLIPAGWVDVALPAQ